MDPNFYKSLFLWLLSKISCKFTVNDLNLKKSPGVGGWFTSLGQLYCWSHKFYSTLLQMMLGGELDHGKSLFSMI